MEVLSIIFMVLMIAIAVILLVTVSLLLGSVGAVAKYGRILVKKLGKLFKIKITFGE